MYSSLIQIIPLLICAGTYAGLFRIFYSTGRSNGNRYVHCPWYFHLSGIAFAIAVLWILNYKFVTKAVLGAFLGYLLFNAVTDAYDKIVYRYPHIIIGIMCTGLLFASKASIPGCLMFFVFLIFAAMLKCYAMGDTYIYMVAGIALTAVGIDFIGLLTFWVGSILLFLIANVRHLKIEKNKDGKTVLLGGGRPVGPFIFLSVIVMLLFMRLPAAL